jgi:hypothetical protein
MYACRLPGYGAVDAFGRQQQRAFDAMRLAYGQQGRLQLGVVGQFNKLVKSGGQEGHFFGRLFATLFIAAYARIMRARALKHAYFKAFCV